MGSCYLLIGSLGPDTVPTIKALLLYIPAAELRGIFSKNLQTGLIADLKHPMNHIEGRY